MSDHYELVISCLLRDDTPADVLDRLRSYLGPDGLLAPDPDSSLPGGHFAVLRRQQEGWGLFSRTFWLDDDYGAWDEALQLIAPYACADGYLGHARMEYELEPRHDVFTVRDGVVTYHRTK